MADPNAEAWVRAGCDGPPGDVRNQRRFALLCLAWAVAFVAAAVLLEGAAPTGAAAWVVALAPSILGFLAVRSYVRFVRDADELVRRIQLESLAWGFGAGALFMMGYRLLERAGAPRMDVSDPLLVMCVVWTTAQLAIARRYR